MTLTSMSSSPTLAAASTSNGNLHQSPSPYLAASTSRSNFLQLFSLNPAATTSSSNFHRLFGADISDKEQLWRCLPLYRALLRGDQRGFEQAARILCPNLSQYFAMSWKITGAGDTPLHVLVGAGKWFDSLMSGLRKCPSGLTLRNSDGHTPLCVAAVVGNMKAAKKLLQLEKELPCVQASNDAVGPYPIIEATRYGHKEMVLLLIREISTKMEGSGPPTKHLTSSLFLHLLIVAGFYDVLLALVRHYPGLARAEFYGDNDESLLSLMAEKPSAFRSGTQLGFWQRLLYSGSIRTMFIFILSPAIVYSFVYVLSRENYATYARAPNGAKLESRLADIEKLLNRSPALPSRESPQPAIALIWARFAKCLRVCVITIVAWIARTINSCIYHVAPIFKHIKDTKLMHEETLDIGKRVCAEFMAQYNLEKIEPLLRKALLSAASSGISEIIEEIIDCYPNAIWFVNSQNRNLFHLAVINRHEKVFNLIYQLSLYKHLVTTDEDTSGNNILHMAGKLAPHDRLNLISGAALQMQRELQWFQEVEKFVNPAFRTKRNSYGKTPKMVFTEEHKGLVKEGEKWMKETANSCIFVAALTATVGFAAAITVPGGNDQNNGFPLFSNETAFTVFAVSVAFGLFSSVASVIMFLSILTSRYAEEDFLKSLPKRLILGLGTLFASMTSLMIAFGATIYLVFGQKKGWILIPVGIAALMPVILFESLQFPLLLDMFMSTYGPSIFRKQSSRILH